MWSSRIQRQCNDYGGDVSKQGLTSVVLLVRYDVYPEIRLGYVASSYGLSALIRQAMDDGQDP